MICEDPILKVLTVAGADPTGGAGIQSDLRTFDRFGVSGRSVIAALTAQDGQGVRGTFPVAPEAFALQLETILQGERIDGLKTGMLLTEENVRVLARLLKHFAPPVVVIDPVLFSSNGIPLLEEEGRKALVEELFPLATVVTPNLAEAQAFSAVSRGAGPSEREWLREMCRRIHDLGPRNVVITGGHLAGDPVDLLYNGKKFFSFASPRVPGDLHGSGCRFSAALCASLARGSSMTEALRGAKEYVENCIRNNLP
ncbi:MAG: bifunctional hydroxymethylpyrimidine kinase/phosphomethylpyrimidine kinase [Deltaproteobacteria bacterium]|nr:bifunctional hydroxymethylpyrimidine kinase/phosphomethylpyrimidine kinase [Deltaproteobacteria bacterium]